ncbi:MAG: hypothetical protein DRO09_00495 [Thermoprotei archaeon]|nr:MAG: hypothetical protein DRO09_00495 [Thermoprotei archaeon]
MEDWVWESIASIEIDEPMTIREVLRQIGVPEGKPWIKEIAIICRGKKYIVFYSLIDLKEEFEFAIREKYPDAVIIHFHGVLGEELDSLYLMTPWTPPE